MAAKKKTAPEDASFILRNMDISFWTKFRERAEREGRTMRWVILTLITFYVRHGLPDEAKGHDADAA